MPLSTQARIPTPNALQYLAEVCRQFELRGQQRPGVRVTRTDDEATIEFGWARSTLRADASALFLGAEAADEDALEQICELLGRHLEAHIDEPVSVAWSHRPSAESHDDRRDRMRAFHARMRAESG